MKNGRMKHRPIINLYRQYDGYPSGHGQELVDFLTQFHAITDGIAVGEKRRTANGMGCLAAQLVHHFKGSVGKEENIAMKGHVPTLAGQFYLYPVECKDCGQDYEYHIYRNKDMDLCVRVKDRGFNMFGLTMSDKDECLFDGPLVKFTKFCKEKA
jgi:hypothetical protein